MTLFLLVRHATTAAIGHAYVGRGPDPGLTAEGKAEAAALAGHLARERIALLHCSPRLRARQTALALSRLCGRPCEDQAALDEVDVGAWSGRRFEELEGDPAWGRWNRARHLHSAPGGEDILAVQTRIVRHLRGLCLSRIEGAAVLVTHAEVIRSALLYYLGLPISAHAALDVGPATIARLEIGPENSRILALNERAAPLGLRDAAGRRQAEATT